MFYGKSVLSKLILPILVILLLSIASYGSKLNNVRSSAGGSPSPTPNSSQNAEPGSSTAAEAKAGVVTYENYLKIKLDTTYDDVKSILGEGKKKEVNADVIRYTWAEQGKNIVILTNKGKVESKTQSKLGKTTPTLTVDQFKQVATGMTIDHVVSILGPDYRETSFKKSADAITRSVVWMMPDSKYIKVNLQDDKVISKSDSLE